MFEGVTRGIGWWRLSDCWIVRKDRGKLSRIMHRKEVESIWTSKSRETNRMGSSMIYIHPSICSRATPWKLTLTEKEVARARSQSANSIKQTGPRYYCSELFSYKETCQVKLISGHVTEQWSCIATTKRIGTEMEKKDSKYRPFTLQLRKRSDTIPYHIISRRITSKNSVRVNIARYSSIQSNSARRIPTKSTLIQLNSIQPSNT